MTRQLLLLGLCALLAPVFTPRVAAQTAPACIVVLISVDGLAQYYFDDPKCEMPTTSRAQRIRSL